MKWPHTYLIVPITKTRLLPIGNRLAQVTPIPGNRRTNVQVTLEQVYYGTQPKCLVGGPIHKPQQSTHEVKRPSHCHSDTNAVPIHYHSVNQLPIHPHSNQSTITCPIKRHPPGYHSTEIQSNLPCINRYKLVQSR